METRTESRVELTSESYIRSHYKIVDVDWLDIFNVQLKLYDMGDSVLPRQSAAARAITRFCLKDQNKSVYKKTDYICNEKERICICNTHAEDFRRIYDGSSYIAGKKFIAWF